MRSMRGKRIGAAVLILYQCIVSNFYSVWREYSEVFEKVGLEDDVRVVVLASGLDKLFTAGLDCKCATLYSATGLTVLKS